MTADEREPEEVYKIWRKTIPWIYDLCITTNIRPSPIVSWVPGLEQKSPAYTTQRMLLGTQNSTGENFVFVSQIRLPTAQEQYNPERCEHGDAGPFGLINGKVECVSRIPHKGKVREVRYMPQVMHIIATTSYQNEVYIFNTDQFTPESTEYKPHRTITPPANSAQKPTEIGTGLVWNKNKAGELAWASTVEAIRVCELSQNPSVSTTALLKGHTRLVNDIEWQPRNQRLLSSVGEDKKLIVWDVRVAPNKAFEYLDAEELTSLAHNPNIDYEIAIASKDGLIRMLDIRTKRVTNMFQALGPVSRLHWSPYQKSLLASSSGNRLEVWDVEQTEPDLEDDYDVSDTRPPELLFVHEGHSAHINDFSWNPNEKCALATVANDGVLHMWRMVKELYEKAPESSDGSVEV